MGKIRYSQIYYAYCIIFAGKIKNFLSSDFLKFLPLSRDMAPPNLPIFAIFEFFSKFDA